MKKFILALLAVMCAACLGLAVAGCKDKEPKYYILTFADADGITYGCEIANGYEVKENATVSFTLSVADGYTGAPVVQTNDDVIEADDAGNYSFKMKGDTTVSVTGVFKINSYLVTFDKGYVTEDDLRDEYRIEYKSDYGDTEEGITVEAGETITFTVDVSVYYGDSSFNVLANTTVVPRGQNGVYSVTVTGRTNITVTGLKTEDGFATRAGCGDGTEENPYKLSKPVDLLHLAQLVQGFYRNSYFTAHYELTADIDMQGEQLYIIGDSQENYFAGTVNGNGHTIKNYYIADSLIDSESLTTVFYPYLGLFGFVAPTSAGNVPRIYGLNVENFYMNINASNPTGSVFYAGGIVGVAFGAEITGCSASGEITADADTNYFGYMGGIVGAQYSTLGDDNTRYYSVTRSCSSDVSLIGESGHVYAAGGIVGAVNTNEERTTSCVLNCCSAGDVIGAMYAGGIAGRISPFSTVQNCYATGTVEARNTIGLNDQNIALGHAYAGGIVGYADYESIVADSFAAGEVYAFATADSAGVNFSHTGDVAGGYDAASEEFIEASPALIYNCCKLTAPDNDYIKNTLGWNGGDWTFGDGFPVINTADADVSFKITVDLGNRKIDGRGTVEVDVKNAYIPMSYWYLLDDNDMDEFITSDDGLRTYGYYFDAAFTKKVPFGYTPMGNVTLYAGWADYKDVAGVYHVRGLGGSLTLAEDGTLTYRNGALNRISDYIYDGEEMILRYTNLAMLSDGESGYYSFKAKLAEDGTLTVYDNALYPESSPLVAVAEDKNFTYGTYYATNKNITYTFEKNGTGTVVDASAVTPVTTYFTFTVKNGEVKMLHNGTEYDCTVSGGKITVCMGEAVEVVDGYAGVWEKSAGSHKQYTFDGKGNWSYEYFGYDNEGTKITLATASGTYTRGVDGIDLGNGTKASFNAQNFLSVDGVEYYKQNSFAGVWSFFSNTDLIELTLNGVGTDGYGTAVLDYNEYAPFGADDTVTYSSRVNNNGDAEITLYLFDEIVGNLVYSAAENTLSGSVYLARTGYVESGATFYLYDDYKGVWISEQNGMEIIEFNGLGNYAVAGNAQHMAVSGTITVNGETAGTYSLENSTLTGKFNYDGCDYTVTLDEATRKIIVNQGETDEFTFEERDGWYGVDLVNASGDKVYSFDGRGNLTSGGTLSVNGDEATYTYKVNGTTVNISGGASGTLTVSGDDYVLNLGTPETLYIANDFTGNWLIAGTDKYLEIGKFNAKCTATGTARDAAAVFTYHPDGNYVTFTSDNATMYINVMEADGVKELAVSAVNNTYGDYSVCVKAGVYDSYMGEYTDKDGNRFVFDGLGGSKFVSGTARLYSAAGGENPIESYSYTVNEFGMPALSNSRGTAGLFVACDSGDGDAFTKDSSSYKLVTPDDLYKLRVYIKNGNNVDKTTSYVFDGVSKIYNGKAVVYSYEIVSHNETRMEYNLKLTGTDEKKYTAVLDYTTSDRTLALTEVVEE